jgi:hypothetical protein
VTETPNETPNGDYFCITHYSLLGRPPLYLPGAGALGDVAVAPRPTPCSQDLMTPRDSIDRMAQTCSRAFAAQLFLVPAGTTFRRHSLPHPAVWPYPRPDSSLGPATPEAEAAGCLRSWSAKYFWGSPGHPGAEAPPDACD